MSGCDLFQEEVCLLLGNSLVIRVATTCSIAHFVRFRVVEPLLSTYLLLKANRALTEEIAARTVIKLKNNIVQNFQIEP